MSFVGNRTRIDPTSRMPLAADGSFEPRAPADDAVKELLALRRAIEARPSKYVELTARTNFSFLAGATPPELMVFRAAELGYDAIAITDRDGLYGIVRAQEEGERQGVRVIVGCELTLEQDGPRACPRRAGQADHAHGPRREPCRVHESLQDPDGEPPAPPEVAAHEAHREPRRGRASAQHVRRHPALVRVRACRGPLGARRRHAADRRAPSRVRRSPLDHRASPQGRRGSRPRHPRPRCRAHPRRSALRDQPRSLREARATSRSSTFSTASARARRSTRPGAICFPTPRLISRARRRSCASSRCIPTGSRAHASSPIAAASRSRSSSYRFPYEITDLVDRDFRRAQAARRDAARDGRPGASPPHRAGRARALRRRRSPRRSRRRSRRSSRSSRSSRSRRTSSRVRAIVDMARRARHPLSGPRQRRQQRGLLLPRHHRGRSRALEHALRALPLRGAPRAARHRRRLRARAPRGGHPGDLRDATAAIARRWCSEVICYRAKSALREVGKVFGFSLEQVERLAGVVTWWDGVSAVSESRLTAIGFVGDRSARAAHASRSRAPSRASRGICRSTSAASCSRPRRSPRSRPSSRRRCRTAPSSPGTRTTSTRSASSRSTCSASACSRRSASASTSCATPRQATRRMRRRRAGLANGTAIERLARIPAEDPAVYDALCRADTVGVFQIESRAQMAMLPRLRPRSFYDLVIEVAIVRPGPDPGRHGASVPAAAERGGEATTLRTRCLAPILERTLGVPLFQEQVMQIAIVGAGYTRRRGRSPASRHGRVAKDGLAREAPRAPARRASASAASRRSSASSSSSRSRASASTASRRPTRRASRSSSTRARGSRCTTRRSSRPRSSTASRWASTHRRRSSRTRSGTASQLAPLDVGVSDWDCVCYAALAPRASLGPTRRVRRGIRLGLRLVSGLGEDAGRRIEKARAEQPVHERRGPHRARAARQEGARALAESGALDELCGGRRDAIWKVVAPRPGVSSRATDSEEARPSLAADVTRRAARPRLRAHGGLRLRPSDEASSPAPAEEDSLVTRHPLAALGDEGQRRRHGHLPAASRHGQRRRLRHDGGRVRVLEPRPLVEGVRAVPAGRDRLAAPHGPRPYRALRRPEGLQASRPSAPQRDLRDSWRESPQSVVYVIAERLERLDAHLPALDSMSRDFH